MKTGGPKSSGWIEDSLPAGLPFKQWTYKNGEIVLREYGRRYFARLFSNGCREFGGEGGGRIVLDGKGNCRVTPNAAGVLAAYFGSGNRDLPVTLNQGKRKVPTLPPEARLVTDIRSLYILPHKDAKEEWELEIPGLPIDPKQREVRETAKLFEAEAYVMISAIVRGDSEMFKQIAQWIEIDEMRRKGELEALITESQVELFTAIREAALAAGEVPTREAVRRAFNAKVRQERKSGDLRESLARHGFGWLPAPAGKPPPQPGQKPG